MTVHRVTAVALVLASAVMLGTTPGLAKTFRYATQADAQTMDPYSIDVTSTTGFLQNIFEGLVHRTPDLKIEPALATSWENTGGNTWRFTLRQGVTFHGGESFAADDVVFSFERIRKPGSDLLGRVASIKSVTKVDDHTVDIETDGPDPTLLANLTNVLIMSREWAEKNGATNPVDLKSGKDNAAAYNADGTGPYRLETREAGLKTVLKANPDWWGQRDSNVDEVVFTPIVTGPTRIAALLSGQIDLADPIPIQDIPRVETAPDVKVLAGPELRSIFLGLDVRWPELLGSDLQGVNPFKDIRVRTAMYKAIDVDLIRDRVMRGRSTPLALLNAPGVNGFNAELNDRPPADPDGARALMKEAGYENGFKVRMNCPNDRYVNDEQICIAVVGMLAKIGIKVDLEAEPSRTYFPKANRHEVSFYLLGNTPPAYDSFSAIFSQLMCPEEIVAGRWPTIKGQGAFNHGGFCSEALDAAARQVKSELDPVKRQQGFDEIWKILKAEKTYIPIHAQTLAWGVRSNVTVSQRPDGVLDLRYVRVD